MSYKLKTSLKSSLPGFRHGSNSTLMDLMSNSVDKKVEIFALLETENDADPEIARLGRVFRQTVQNFAYSIKESIPATSSEKSMWLQCLHEVSRFHEDCLVKSAKHSPSVMMVMCNARQTRIIIFCEWNCHIWMIWTQIKTHIHLCWTMLNGCSTWKTIQQISLNAYWISLLGRTLS